LSNVIRLSSCINFVSFYLSADKQRTECGKTDKMSLQSAIPTQYVITGMTLQRPTKKRPTGASFLFYDFLYFALRIPYYINRSKLIEQLGR